MFPEIFWDGLEALRKQGRRARLGADKGGNLDGPAKDVLRRQAPEKPEDESRREGVAGADEIGRAHV